MIFIIAGSIALFFNPTTKTQCQFTAPVSGTYNYHKLLHLGNINKSEYPECNFIDAQGKHE